jgi:hypothetical protein
MSEEIGENLVGAYLRHVLGCELLLFNTCLPSDQGEIDVIGIRLGPPRDVYFAEVSSNLDGMLYGNGNGNGNKDTGQKVRDQLLRAQRFAKEKFHGDQHHFQIWSPKVAKGALTEEFATIAAEFAARDVRLTFMVNGAYGDAVQELIGVARSSRASTSDPAFWLLQVLSTVQTSDGQQLLEPPRNSCS